MLHKWIVNEIRGTGREEMYTLCSIVETLKSWVLNVAPYLS